MFEVNRVQTSVTILAASTRLAGGAETARSGYDDKAKARPRPNASSATLPFMRALLFGARTGVREIVAHLTLPPDSLRFAPEIPKRLGRIPPPNTTSLPWTAPPNTSPAT